MSHIITPQEETILQFWKLVWDEGKTELIDEFVTINFVIHSGGKNISGRENFREWVTAFQSKIGNLRFIVKDIFSSENKVATRWKIEGVNKGFMATEENNKSIELTGITISIVDNGQIVEKWVERNAWELYPTIN